MAATIDNNDKLEALAFILQLTPPDQFRAKLESLGIGDGLRVVVYFGKN